MKQISQYLALAIIAVVLAGCANARNELGLVDHINAPGVDTEIVLIGTTRAVSDNPIEIYSSKRARQVNYSSIVVSIPPNHEEGHVEAPGSSPDPATNFATTDFKPISDQAAFIAKVNSRLAKQPPDGQEVSVFVHGYNNTFSEGLFRTAQMHDDFDVVGVPVYYSWPSAAQLTLYTYDRDSANYARDGLLSMLEALAKTNAKHVTLIGHSMGTFVVMEALRQGALSGKKDALGKISLVVLASPDIDVDVFREQVNTLLPLPFTMAVLVSSDDRALEFSSRLRGGHPRVGSGANQDELTKMGITVLDLSKIDEGDSLQHSKFASSPTFINLIRKRIAYDKSINADKGRGDNLFNSAGSLVGDATKLIIRLPRAVTGR